MDKYLNKDWPHLLGKNQRLIVYVLEILFGDL